MTCDSDNRVGERCVTPPASDDPLALADWRRRVQELYACIRADPDPSRAWHMWREHRDWLFREHPMSPVPRTRRACFRGIPVFEYDPSLRVAARLQHADGQPVTVEIGGKGVLSFRPIAQTEGLEEGFGRELTVFWIEGYGGGLFLPFRDRTTARETYGGGRYLLDAIKGADLGVDSDGRLILDFNFSYHPSCAWNDAYVCPLATTANTLAVPVRAGERMAES